MRSSLSRRGRRALRVGLATAIALGGATFVRAQTPGEIVVTGRALPTTPGDAAFADVTIAPARIASTASNRIEDVLRDVAGVQQFRRSDARSANPTSQGVTLRGLGGNAAARALVLLDGVPQGDPFGGFIAWPLYATTRIGAVRVTRGGGSGVAGPGALAGTIALDSVDANSGGLVAQMAGGSRASVEGQARIAGRVGGGFGLIAVNYARSDGFVPTIAEQRGPADVAAPFTQASLALRGVVPVGRMTELQANLAVFDDRRTRGTAFSANRTRGADASLRLVGRGGLPFALLGYVQVRAFASEFAAVDVQRRVATPTLDQFDTPATGLGARLELRPRLAGLDLRLGGDLRHVVGETQERFTFAGGNFTRLRTAGGSGTTAGGFVDAGVTTGPLLLTAGGRVDHWRLGQGRLFERTIGTGAVLTDTRSAPRSGWEATGRVGAALTVSPAITLRAAGYRGWRLPTLNELYRPFRVGADAVAANDALSPERSEGVEIGARWAPSSRVSVNATAFSNRLAGAVVNVALGQGPGSFPGVGFVAGTYRQRLNVAAIVSRGAEVDVRASWQDWSLSASLAYADARVRAVGIAAPLAGLRPAGTAPLTASATLGWRGVSATLRYASAQFDDDQNLRRLPPALTLDTVATWPLARGLRGVVRAENVFDARVAAALSGAGVTERATPRTLWAGIAFDL